MSGKPILVGESNPYGANPEFALYPAPDGCSGHRLCCLILGMRRQAYMNVFERVNLVDGKWSMKAARSRAEELIDGKYGFSEEQPLILLGSKVASAFSVTFRPYEQLGEDILMLPHPSGLCRLWGDPGAYARAREAVLRIAPELADVIGKAEGQSCRA